MRTREGHKQTLMEEIKKDMVALQLTKEMPFKIVE